MADSARKALKKVSEKVDKLQKQGEEQLKEAVQTLENVPVKELKAKPNYIPYIIAGGAIIYLLTKKKR